MDTTTDTAATKPPAWYWVVAILALIWMLFGVLAWVMDLTMDAVALEKMSEPQQQLYLQRPQWIFIVYAVAIFSGLAGVIALLLRKSWATLALGISLAAIIVQFGYTFLAMHAVQRLGAAAALPFPLVIFVIGLLLLLLSRRAHAAGWTRR